MISFEVKKQKQKKARKQNKTKEQQNKKFISAGQKIQKQSSS